MESYLNKIYIKYLYCLLYNNTIVNCVDFKILNMILNTVFTWWNKQTFGTFLKTLFFGNFVGKDQLGNRYYKSKKNERWVIYSSDVEATKITSDWYLWIHHTVDKIPAENNKKKYLWQKKHLENQTGSKNSYKPIKITKSNTKKKI